MRMHFALIIPQKMKKKKPKTNNFVAHLAVRVQCMS